MDCVENAVFNGFSVAVFLFVAAYMFTTPFARNGYIRSGSVQFQLSAMISQYYSSKVQSSLVSIIFINKFSESV
jgi:hypothetical protein